MHFWWIGNEEHIGQPNAATPRKNNAKTHTPDSKMPFCIALHFICCEIATWRHNALVFVGGMLQRS